MNAIRRKLFAAKAAVLDRTKYVVFERPLGLDTTRLVNSETLGYEDTRQGFYQPAGWRTLQRVLPRGSVGPNDVFLDLGSGMGRMVLRAAQMPFSKVIGVELSPELHAVAENNLAVARPKLRCTDVEFFNCDATSYEIPDDMTVLFLYNPFNGEIFEAAIQNVIDSYARSPRRIRILYSNPTEHDRLMATGRVELVGKWQRGAWRRRPRGVLTRCYEVNPG